MNAQSKTAFIRSVFITQLFALLCMYSYASEAPVGPPVSPSQYTGKIIVKPADKPTGQQVGNMARRIRQGDWTSIPSQVIPLLQPVNAAQFMPPFGRFDETDEENVRAELARYLVLTFPPDEVPSALGALRSDPDIEFAEVVPRVELLGEDCEEINASESVPVISDVSIDWHLDQIQAQPAWDIQDGIATVGIADTGVDPGHPALIAFLSGNYNQGNIHTHMSFQVGDRSSDTKTNWGHPFDGAVFFGDVDEIEYQISSSSGEDCGMTGSMDFFRGGHGTHVTGLLAARKDGFGTSEGVCRSCPVMMGHFRTPALDRNGQCLGGGTDPWTGAQYDQIGAISFDSFFSSIAFLADLGAQVISVSGGVADDPNIEGDEWSCSDPALAPLDITPYCEVLEYLTERDVMIFASAGNGAVGIPDWPAKDPRVFGVTGSTRFGGVWSDGVGCGSNSGNDVASSKWPDFIAPAKEVYSTMYPDRTWIAGPCHEYNDGVQGDGYGYCTGTSMSSPLVAGIAALVRSADPLATVQEAFAVIRDTADNGQLTGSKTSLRGWGIPQAYDAVRQAYGAEGGVQSENGQTPLFRMYSSDAGGFFVTTKPQMAVTVFHDLRWNYDSYSGSPLVSEYTEFPNFTGPSSAPSAPRADLFVLTGHKSPFSGNETVPMYLMLWNGTHNGSSNNADWYVTTSESDIQTFHSNGYNLKGKIGYLIAPCSTSGCIPAGMVKVYRAYNSTLNDHSVFPESQLSSMQSLGYTEDTALLGYAFPN